MTASPDNGTSRPAIVCRDLRKTYVVYDNLFRGLAHRALRPGRPNPHAREVHALNGVTFSVEKGQVFGILGHNGAGKSTLLGCIAGISPFDGGSLEVDGKIDALLRLGVGFHPYFTGRDNALVGLVAMGTPIDEARGAVDSVLEFAEVTEFADMPFYTYSSGMKSRLQFAVAVHRTPEILILDEALSAGDGFFNSKARQRIEQICNSGSTVLLVTHSVGMVESLCSQAIILKKGELVGSGTAAEMGAQYRRMMVEADTERQAQAQSSREKQVADYGSGEISIVSSRIEFDGDGDVAAWDRPVTLVVELEAREPVVSPRFRIEIFSARDGILVTTINNFCVDPATRSRRRIALGELEGAFELRCEIPALPLGGGSYFWSIALMPKTPRRKLETPADYYLYRRLVGYFRVESFRGDPPGRTVVTEVPANVSVSRAQPDHMHPALPHAAAQ